MEVCWASSFCIKKNHTTIKKKAQGQIEHNQAQQSVITAAWMMKPSEGSNFVASPWFSPSFHIRFSRFSPSRNDVVHGNYPYKSFTACFQVLGTFLKRQHCCRLTPSSPPRAHDYSRPKCSQAIRPGRYIYDLQSVCRLQLWRRVEWSVQDLWRSLRACWTDVDTWDSGFLGYMIA